MGIFDVFKKEIKREFIARPDDSKSNIIYKWPDSNIRLLTQLTVQQDEVALFFKKGEIVGQLGPGTHTLDGASIPFLSILIDAATGGDFLLSELYFVSTRQFTDLPFGGMIDNVLDPNTNLAVGLRVFGEYALTVDQPEKLILNLVGTQQLDRNEQLTDWVKDLMMKVLKEIVSADVSSNKQQILGIASKTSEYEKEVLERLSSEVAQYGISIPKIGNFTITLKEEDEATLKQMTRDFAYSQNMDAADAAVKLGMAKGMSDGTGAGSSAADAAATGMGIAMGMEAMKKKPSKDE